MLLQYIDNKCRGNKCRYPTFRDTYSKYGNRYVTYINMQYTSVYRTNQHSFFDIGKIISTRYFY